jgi:hypothetical protein
MTFQSATLANFIEVRVFKQFTVEFVPSTIQLQLTNRESSSISIYSIDSYLHRIHFYHVLWIKVSLRTFTTIQVFSGEGDGDDDNDDDMTMTMTMTTMMHDNVICHRNGSWKKYTKLKAGYKNNDNHSSTVCAHTLYEQQNQLQYNEWST